MHLSLLDHVALGGMLILIAALALSLGGVSLVFYSARMTREAIGKRVDLVRGDAGVVVPSITGRTPLIRTRPRGSGEREIREVERLVAKFGIAATCSTGRRPPSKCRASACARRARRRIWS